MILILSVVVLVIVLAIFGVLFLSNGLFFAKAFLPSLRRFKLIQKLPGPKGHYVLGNALLLLSIPHEDILIWGFKLFSTHPRFFKVWIFGLSYVFIKDADDIQVLLNSTDHIGKGLEYHAMQTWLEEGLLTSKGEKWHMRRKMLTPAFHYKILQDNISIFNVSSKNLRDTFQNKINQEIELEQYISKCTLNVIMKAAMGIDLNDLKQEEAEKYISEIQTLTELLAHRQVNPHLFSNIIFNLSPSGRRYNKAVSYVHKFSSQVIKERKMKMKNEIRDQNTISSSGKVRKAFLDLMLEYQMKNPGTLNDNGIREEVDTFMFEGHDTTSSALKFIFYSLATHQNIQEKVYDELSEIFRDSDRDADNNDLQRMVYLEQVIKESMRLHPPVPVVTRLLEKDLILSDGTIIPAWTDVLVLTFVLHKNEKYWTDPNKFDPERFTEDKINGRHPYSYLPFSAGPRNCIGQKFAMLQLKTVVSTVLRKLKILPVSRPEEVKEVVYMILRTSKPIKCKFVLREK